MTLSPSASSWAEQALLRRSQKGGKNLWAVGEPRSRVRHCLDQGQPSPRGEAGSARGLLLILMLKRVRAKIQEPGEERILSRSFLRSVETNEFS